jgi:ADP-sugar diphosphatase
MTSRLDAINNEIQSCVTQLRNTDSAVFLQTKVPDISKNGKFNEILICGHPIRIEIHNSLILNQTHPTVFLEHQETPEQTAKFFCEQFLQFEAFKTWCHKFDPAFFTDATFSTIYILSVQWFGSKIGFVEFKTDQKFTEKFNTKYKAMAIEKRVPADKIKNPEISNIVFMRGGSVAILVMLIADNGMRWGVLTVQPRAAIGKYNMAEIPAGMMDKDDNFFGVAAKELKEETGLVINSSDLEDLTEDLGYNVVYPSCGGCDEFMKFFLYRTKMANDKIESLRNKCTGAYEEGENIKLKVVPFDRMADHSPDMKTLTALYLYEQHCRRKHYVYDMYGERRG